MDSKAAWLYENGHPAGETSNTAKYSAAEAAVGAADHVIQASRRRRLTEEYGQG
jgi:alkylation response protein AidB-like acyl-CoA dehydrogenase